MIKQRTLKRIVQATGVTFQNPGYRGGEYGYQFYNNGVSINGDSRVVVLFMDGFVVKISQSPILIWALISI